MYTTGLIDITRGINWSNSSIETPGDNDLTRSHNRAFKTTKGFDLASGFGRPIASGLACPQINSISPRQGRAGQFITLRGAGLEKATIKFGKKIAPVVVAGPLKAIVVLVPGSNGEGRRMADDTLWQSFAVRNHCAIIASRFTDKPPWDDLEKVAHEVVAAGPRLGQHPPGGHGLDPASRPERTATGVPDSLGRFK